MDRKITKVLLTLALTFGFGALGFSQLANVTFSVRTNNVTSYENATGGACWETGDEEYTAYVFAWDNANTSQAGTGCQTCTNNGNCGYAGGINLFTRTSNAYSIFTRIDAWEDDQGGRCDYNTSCSGFLCVNLPDDCRRQETVNFDFRETAFPSNGAYSFAGNYGSTGDHTWALDYTWRYSGTANVLTAQCYPQSVGYNSGIIPSYSMFLTAGQTYQFGTCGATNDTRIRIFAPDGYTLVGDYDDNGPLCSGLAASGNFTPTTTGWHYLEIANFSRNQLSAGGTLTYRNITPNPGNPAVFGNNVWNVYVYSGQDINLGSGVSYYGTYTETSLSWNSLNRWCSTCSPANANSTSGSTYSGCDPGVDNHTIVYKRQGFPCGFYRLDMPNHDDEVRVYINGVNVFEHIGCCDVHTGFWQGCLNSTSTIEYRWGEGGGGSNGSLTFVDQSTLPTISCPANISVNAGSACNAVATYATPTASDECGITSVVRIGGPASGSTFALGNTTVTWRATDNCGQTNTCSFTVTVNDVTAPSISCPGNITVSASATTCGAAVAYTTPNGTDNCLGASTVRTSGLASGSTFPVGTTTNSFTVTAANGQTASCSFTVTVADNVAPTMVCPPNVTVNAASGQCGANVCYTSPEGADNCAPASPSGFGPAIAFGGNYYFISTAPAFWTNAEAACRAAGGHMATVSGSAENSFLVSISGGNNLWIGYTDQVQEGLFQWTGCETIGFTSWNGGEPNNAGNEDYTELMTNGLWNDLPNGINRFYVLEVEGARFVQTAGLGQNAFFPVGTTTNTFVATDASGNTGSCSFTVSVVDNQNPNITCPSNITVNASAGTCAANVSYTTPTASDNCPGVTVARTAGPASGSSFAVGTTTVTHTATDAAGRTASCSFTVTVVDNQAPSITCPANISVNNAPGACTANVTYTSPAGTDNCPGATTVRTAGLASGSAFPVGTTTNSFTVTAANGQTASCSFTVTVIDNQAPVITCPASISVNNTPGACNAAVTFSAPVGTDNCPGATTAQTAGLGSGATYPVGTTTNSFTVTAANGQTASCSFTVTVVDNEAPVVTCPAPFSLCSDDFCQATLPNLVSSLGTTVIANSSADFFGGQGYRNWYYGQYFAFQSGNFSQLPTWTGFVWQGGQAFGTPFLDANGGHPGVNDLIWAARRWISTYNGAVNLHLEFYDRNTSCGDGAHVRVFQNGTEIWNYFNIPGNLQAFDIPATLACGDRLDFVIDPKFDAGCDDTHYTVVISANNSASASDNCGIATVTQSPAALSSLSLGSNPVTLTATDVNGNSSTCTVNVTVIDQIAPVITCPSNISVIATSANGAAVTYTAPAGTDNCPGATTAQVAGLASGATFPLGTTTNTFTVTDGSGNTASCSFTVSVTGVAPSIVCPANITVSTDQNQCSAAVGFAATDAVGIPASTITYSTAPGSTFPVGTATVTATATNAVGSSSCTFTVTVQDNQAPNAVCQNLTVFLNGAGSAAITAQQVDGGSNDACGIAGLSATPTSFTCNAVGANNVTLTVTDNNGNSSTCTSIVTVVDTIRPTAVCQDVTVQLDAQGQGSTTANAVDNGSTDACGIASLSLNNTSFGCQNVGANTVVLTVTDNNGNSSTCTATVTVQDNIAPAITCPPAITVSCDVSNQPSNTGTATASDNCAVGSITFADVATLNGCNGTGTIARTWTATDPSGNATSCVQAITVIDNTPPSITVLAQGQTVECDGGGNLAQLNAWFTGNGGAVASDNCGSVTWSAQVLSQQQLCGFTGTATVRFTATDACGNASSTTASFTIVDTTPPSLVLPADVTIACATSTAPTSTGTATATDLCTIGNNPVFWINEFHYDNGANDVNEFVEIAGTAGFSLSGVSLVFYDGATGLVYNTVALSGVIPNQQAGYGTLGFLVPGIEDGPDGIALVAGGFVVQFLSYEGSFTAVNGPAAGQTSQQITAQESGSTGANKSVSLVGSGSIYNQFVWIGPQTLFNASRGARNSFQTFVAPAGVVVSHSDVTNLGGCNGTGTITRTWTATDGCGNSSTGVQTISVIDNVAPNALCRNITVQLNATGSATITPSMVDNGSSDLCGAVSLSISNSSYTCSNVGGNTVTLTVTDNCGNSSTCTSTVTVQDTVRPTAVCQGVTVQLDAQGSGSTTANAVNNGSSDACGIASLSLSQTAFGCSNVGANTVTLTVTDVNGNSSTCTATVTVEDNVAPVAICQNVTVYLNGAGQGSTTANAVNNGSSDACGIANLSLSNTSFNCGDVAGGAVLASDLFFSEYIEGSGNNKCVEIYNGTGAAINLATSGYAIRVYFNGATTFTTFNLNGTVAAGDVYVFCQQNATAGFLAQADQTTNFGIWTGDDAVVLVKGSQVLDIIGRIGEDPGSAWVAPGIQTSERTLVRNANIVGGVTTNPSAGFPTMPTQWTSLGTDVSSNLGIHTFTPPGGGGPSVTLTVTDVNGNSSTCTATVTVLDTVRPTAICQAVTVQLNAQGTGSTTANAVNNGSSDACGISSLVLSQTNFTCTNVGANTVTLTVTDNNNNASTCTATVTVEDNVAPVALCQAVTVQLDAQGNGSTTANAVNNGSSDACGIASLSLSQTAFGCQNVGANTVILTVTDNNGNASTCTATVTVEDNVAPVALCQDVTVQLDAQGNGSTTANAVDNGSNDACGIASLVLSQTAFDCQDANPSTTSNLFISEYIEGSSNNKCIEIYNGTGSAVNLSAGGYALRFYFNGSTSAATTIALTGTVAAGDVYVVCDDNSGPAFLAQADQQSTSNFYNGNDAVELVAGSTTVDLIGRIGENPGAQWSLGGNQTADRTLVRNATVSGGVVQNPALGFPTLGAEWTQFGQDNLANLGSHSYTPSGNHVVVLTVTDNNGNISTCTSTVTVEDNVAPVAICQNVTVNLDSTGSQTITPSQVDAGSNDACGIASLGLNPNTFDCSNAGSNVVTLTVTDVNGNVSTCSAQVTVTTDPLLVSTASPTYNCGFNVSCNGNTDGSATATVSGGCLPYSYLWSDGQTTATASNLGAGTYTVTVTDNNGTAVTSTIVLTQPNVLTATLNRSNYNCGYNISCNGASDGRLAAVPTGGCAPYTYLWSNGSMNRIQPNLTAGTYTVTVTDNNGCTFTIGYTLTEPAPLVATGIVPAFNCGYNISCNGASDGSINLGVTGGASCAGYAYVWSNGATSEDISNLGAGTYGVTVTDVNGCVTSASFTLTEPAPLVSTLSLSQFNCGYNVSCNGANDGTINQLVSGGCAPYTYNWSTGSGTQNVQGLTAGTYSVTITDANGCQIFKTAELLEPAPLVGSGTAATYACGYNVSCNGASDGSIDFGAVGGADCQPYAYLWSTGATTEDVSGLSAGTYSVTVTDVNGCFHVTSYTLTQPDPLAAPLIPSVYACGNNISCNGASDGEVMVIPSGGCAPYTYSWSNGATTRIIQNLTAGTYSVTMTDANGCNISASITLTQPTPLVSSATSPTFACGANVSCNGATDGSIVLAASGGNDCQPYTFRWSNGSQQQNPSGLGAGTYTVTVTDVGGCESVTTITLTEPSPLVGTAQLSLYACGRNISCEGGSDGSINLSVTGGADCQAYSYVWSNGANTEDVANLSAGTYSVTITDVNGCTVTYSYTLTEPAKLLTSLAPSVYACGYGVSCYGATDGSVDLTVTGGADCQAYSYQWSNGATTEDLGNLAAGTYSVTVTDVNGCTATTQFTLVQPNPVATTGTVPTFACGYNISCNGASDGSVNLTATGGASCLPYAFQWSNGATTEDVSGLAAGTYSVTVTDANGCSATRSFTLTQPNPLVIDAGPNQTVYAGYPGQDCATLTATGQSGGCAPYALLWTDGNGATIGTAATVTVCPTVTTTYYVTITDQNGCSFTDSLLVCAVNVVCGQSGQNPRIEICHIPPGNPGNASTMCLPLPSIANHLAHGDYLGACNLGPNPPCDFGGSAKVSENGGGQGAGAEMAETRMSMDAFPNPFEGETTIRFSVPEAQDVVIEVFDLRGEKIAMLFDGECGANASQEVKFRPEHVTDGIYMARMTTSNGEVKVRRLVLIK